MSDELHQYLEDYAERHPGVRERWAQAAEAFFQGCEGGEVGPVCSPSECARDHDPVAGPNMDLGQCPDCWMPIGVLRPYGESFGWHSGDCSLPLRHPGYCAPGGSGHAIPDGWKIRG